MKQTRKSNKLLLPGVILVAAMVFTSNRAGATLDPPGCHANNLGYNISKDHNNVTNGTVVTYISTIYQLSDPSTCDIILSSNGLVFSCPDANGNPVGSATTLIPGGTTLVPGFSQSFTNQCTINVNPGIKTAQVSLADNGAVLEDNPAQNDPAAILKTLSVNIFTPCINVTKQCDGGPFLYNAPIHFTGIVTNCGDVVLTGVAVVDDQVGILLTNITLAPGGQPGSWTNYSASYLPTNNLCGPFTNNVTATGTAPLDTPVTVTDSASAVCTITTTPCINVTKTCPPTIVFGTTNYVVSGIVTNCGNVPLVGVTVMDDNGTPGNPADDITINIGGIPVGGTVPYSATNTVPVACGPFTDEVIASGDGACGGTVSATNSCTTQVSTAPCIDVTKTCPASIVFGTTNYVVSGIVTNCGNVPLVGVTVVDDNGTPANAADDIIINIGGIPIGGTAAYTATNTVPVACGPFTDKVIASGNGQCGGAVSATNSCTTQVSTAPCISVTKTCPASIVFGVTNYVVSGIVTNCGNVPLVGVTVVDDNGTPTNAADDITIDIGTLPIGGTAPYSATNTVPVACGPFTDKVVASGNGQCGDTVSATNTCTTQVSTSPCIDVTKTCPPSIVFGTTSYVVSGIVTNCGNVPLVGVTVVDDNGTPTNAADDITINIGGIPIGGTAAYTATNTVPVGCGPFTDKVIASGNGQCGDTVSATNSCTTEVSTAPCINVTKSCPASIVFGVTNYVVSGIVTNCGNVPLVGVTVVDDNGTPTNAADDITINIGGIPIGGTAAYTATNTVPVGCGPFTDKVIASGNGQCGGTVTATNTCTTIVTTAPAIAVVKMCPPNPVQPGGLMVVTGTVTNTGNVPLMNVLVTNSISALGVSRRVLGPITLAPGAVTNFGDSYLVPLDSCGPYADTFTVQGADICSGIIVSNSDTKLCAGTNTPRIVVTKSCPPVPTAPGQITTVFGVVSNAGNITLLNVIVVDNQPSNNTVVLGPITLVPGQAVNWTNSYRLPPNSCECVDTVIATGVDKCFGKTVTDSATAACPTATVSGISVTKNCPPLPTPLGQPLVFFGVVSNTGNITLTNVTVMDNQPSNNTPVFGPATLAPGESAFFIGSFIVPIDICDTNILDTVTARGNNLCSGSTVSSSQSALCPILPVPRLVVTKNCPEAPVPPGGLLVFTGSVSNAGNITLTNVLVFNDRPTNNTPLLGPLTLAPGQSTNFSGSYYVCKECCPPYVDTITASGAQICNGSNVTATATAYCPGITTPQISLTVNCPPDPASQGQLLVYSGTVSNAGDVTVGNIIVSDDQAGFVTEIIALAPGETEDFVGGFVPTNCGPNIVTLVSATAWDVCTGNSVSNEVSASCLVICRTNSPPILTGPAVHTDTFTFSFGTVQGKSYTVEFTPSLSPVNWQTLTNFVGDGSVVTISDTPATDPQRFYRVLVQ